MPFTATYMKGRGNYLCLHRFEALKDSGGDPFAGGARLPSPAIDEWSRETETGDRAEMEDLPEDLPFWPEIAATSENCIGTECPRFNDCFVTRMRQRAAESDLVIVNHHLLCADASVRQSAFGEVIPACRYAIVDEAHQLEDVATQYFGRGRQQLSLRRLRARRRPRRRREPSLGRDRGVRARATTSIDMRDAARDCFSPRLQRLRFEAAGASQVGRPTAGCGSRRQLLEHAAADAAAARRRTRGASRQRSR